MTQQIIQQQPQEVQNAYTRALEIKAKDVEGNDRFITLLYNHLDNWFDKSWANDETFFPYLSRMIREDETISVYQGVGYARNAKGIYERSIRMSPIILR